MAEITVSLSTFKSLKEDWEAYVFESSEAVAMPFGSHLIRDFKRSQKRLYRKSLPMLSIGYSGIASWKMTPLKSNHSKKRDKKKQK